MCALHGWCPSPAFQVTDILPATFSHQVDVGFGACAARARARARACACVCMCVRMRKRHSRKSTWTVCCFMPSFVCYRAPARCPHVLFVGFAVAAITALRDANINKSAHWRQTLSSWTCPTDPAGSAELPPHVARACTLHAPRHTDQEHKPSCPASRPSPRPQASPACLPTCSVRMPPRPCVSLPLPVAPGTPVRAACRRLQTAISPATPAPRTGPATGSSSTAGEPTGVSAQKPASARSTHGRAGGHVRMPPAHTPARQSRWARARTVHGQCMRACVRACVRACASTRAGRHRLRHTVHMPGCVPAWATWLSVQ